MGAEVENNDTQPKEEVPLWDFVVISQIGSLWVVHLLYFIYLVSLFIIFSFFIIIILLFIKPRNISVPTSLKEARRQWFWRIDFSTK